MNRLLQVGMAVACILQAACAHRTGRIPDHRLPVSSDVTGYHCDFAGKTMIVSVPKTGALRLGDQGDMTHGEFAATIEEQVKEFGSGYCLRIRAERKTLYSQIRPVVQTAFENKLYPRLDLYAPSWGTYAVSVDNPATMMAPKSGQVVIRVRIGHDQLMWDGKPITQDRLRDIVYQLGDIDDECPFVLQVENDATCQDIANVLDLCYAVGLRQIYLQDAPPRNSTSPTAPTTK